MEAFSLLKYWRGGGLVGTPASNSTDITTSANMRTTYTTTANTSTTTILTAVSTQNRDHTDDDDSSDGGDDGSFFDLEFAVPDEDEPKTHKPSRTSTDGSDEDDECDDDDDDDDDCDSDDGVEDAREFNFTVSSGSSHDRTDDPNLTLSPSDDLFFKGKLVPIEPSSIEFNPSEESNSKPQFSVSLLKSATKFRVFMLGLKKPKSNSNGSEKAERTEQAIGSVEPQVKTQLDKQQQEPEEPPQQKQKRQGKLFTVKFKVEEVPIVSLFTRDNSSRISATNKSQTSTQTQRQKPISTSDESASEEKRFSKEVMQKYLKMVKPFYVRVSKRYGEKLRLSGHLSLNGSQTVSASNPAASAEKSQLPAEASGPPVTASTAKTGQKQVNFPAGLRLVCKHLGKSRSASSAVAAAPSGVVVSQRRDDSLLQQQDGIQSAILHCKRSFNASIDLDSTLLSRCASNPSNETQIVGSRQRATL